MNGSDDLVSSPASMAAELSALQSQYNPAEEAMQMETASEEMKPLGAMDDGGIEAPELEFWGDKQKQAQAEQAEGGPEASTQDASQPKPAETITFKANGEDITLTREEAAQRLSLAEGARQALTDRAKLKKEVALKDQQMADLKKYQDSWDKLESIKHDKKQLIELLTGENYDDFMQRELEKREIYQFGTDEQKRLLEYQEKLDNLERSQSLEKQRRESDLKKTQESAYQAEKTRIETAMHAEYFKHKMPEGMDVAEQTRLKKMLWNQSREDIKEYQKVYGKITQKMVEKSFADNAAVLLRANKSAVEKQVQQTRQEEKRVAKQEAQIASTRESTGLGANAPDLTKMKPTQLLQFLTGRR